MKCLAFFNCHCLRGKWNTLPSFYAFSYWPTNSPMKIDFNYFMLFNLKYEMYKFPSKYSILFMFCIILFYICTCLNLSTLIVKQAILFWKKIVSLYVVEESYVIRYICKYAYVDIYQFMFCQWYNMSKLLSSQTKVQCNYARMQMLASSSFIFCVVKLLNFRFCGIQAIM